LAAYQESLLKSYREISASGTNFSGSLTDMRLAAANAYLTLDQFTDIVKHNSATLANMGGTVNDGAIAFSRLQNQILRSDLGNQLMGLGLSAEDVGQGMLTFIAATGGRSREELANTGEITRATGDYLTELDKLTQFTGTSRKEQEEIQKRASTNGAYQLALSNMSERDRAKAAAGLAMAATQGQGAMDHFMAKVAGLPDITKESQQYAGMFPDAAAGISGVADAAIDTTKSMKDVENAFGSANEGFVNGVNGSQDALKAMALGGNKFANDTLLSAVKLKNQGADTAEGTSKILQQITDNQTKQGSSQAAAAAQTELAVKQLSASLLSDLLPVIQLLLIPLNYAAQFIGSLGRAIASNTPLMVGFGLAATGLIGSLLLARTKLAASTFTQGYRAGGLTGALSNLGIQKVFVVNLPGGGLGGGLGGLGGGGLGGPGGGVPGSTGSLSDWRKGLSVKEQAQEAIQGIQNTGQKAMSSFSKLSLGTKLSMGGAAAGIVGELGSNYAKDHDAPKTGASLDILSQVAGGASTGALFGPWGAAIGGALGLASGLYNNIGTLLSKENENLGSPSQEGLENTGQSASDKHYAEIQRTNDLLSKHLEVAQRNHDVAKSTERNTWISSRDAEYNSVYGGVG